MNRLAQFVSGRMHYGWIVAGIVFAMLLCSAGVRATPGVLIIPIEKALGDVERVILSPPAGIVSGAMVTTK